MIKKILGKFIPMSIKKQLINFYTLAFKYGQYETINRWDCVDKDDNQIPWYTYPAIEYLNNLDFSEKNIFEYGSGNSSTYWSNRAKEVVSIEHDKEWYDKIRLSLNKNQTLLYKEDNKEYENSISTTGFFFDVIVIDGTRRLECSKVIKMDLNKILNKEYMIILDNSDWFKSTAKYLKEELDLIEIDFHGFGAINGYTWTTSIFISRNYDFKAIDNIQPHFSVSGIKQIA